MFKNFENWHQELLEMDTATNHKQTLAEIEIAILESPAADDRGFRLKVFWLLRHVARLV